MLRTCPRTGICPLPTRHKCSVPPPFAFFANGWEAANLNRPPLNSVFGQILRDWNDCTFRIACRMFHQYFCDTRPFILWIFARAAQTPKHRPILAPGGSRREYPRATLNNAKGPPWESRPTKLHKPRRGDRISGVDSRRNGNGKRSSNQKSLLLLKWSRPQR